MKKLVIAIVAIAALGSAVFAGEWKKDGSLLLGYGMPSGDIGDVIDGGIAFGADYDGYKVNDNVMIGGEFIYTGGSGSVLTVDYDFSVIGITPYVKYTKEVDLGGNKADIYGLFGMGMYFGSTDVTYPAGYSALDSSASDSDFGFNFGGGIMFPLKDNMKLGADLRYHLMSSDVSYFIPAAKFTYSF